MGNWLAGSLVSARKLSPTGFLQAGRERAVPVVQAEGDLPLWTHLVKTHRLHPHEDLHMQWPFAFHVAIEFAPFL